MDWKDLVQNAAQYGFLGPIVGIAGLFIGAGVAILFGWTRAFDAWKPPLDVLPEPLSRMVTMLCAVAIFVVWILAEPTSKTTYVHAVLWLAGGAVLAFLAYVGLRTYCGFYRPLVDAHNQPAGEEVIWGGFWKTPKGRQASRDGEPPEKFLAGNNYVKSAVWPPGSLAAAAVTTALVLLVALVCGTSAISTAATAAQVALTKRPAREVFGPANVPGLPPAKQTPAQGGPPANSGNKP
jgi:hypothetical protein